MDRTLQQFIGSVIVAILYGVSIPIPPNMSIPLLTISKYALGWEHSLAGESLCSRLLVQDCKLTTAQIWAGVLNTASTLHQQLASLSSLRFRNIHEHILQLHDFPYSH
jgi:hypothetical protein